jgi:hypothetical protein
MRGLSRCIVVLGALLGACGGNHSNNNPYDLGVVNGPVEQPGIPPDLGVDLGGPDLAVRPVRDLAWSDLGGLVDCFNVAVCDPTLTFCIRYHSGSAADPGTLSTAPACFEPGQACADNGQNMDCGCIQNDPNLGPQCQGSCVDNMDGTYECYAK